MYTWLAYLFHFLSIDWLWRWWCCCRWRITESGWLGRICVYVCEKASSSLDGFSTEHTCVCVCVCVYKNMCLYGSLCIFIYIFKNTDGFINISRTHFFTWKTATRKATSNDEYVHIYFWDIHTLNFYLFIFGAEKKNENFIYLLFFWK